MYWWKFIYTIYMLYRMGSSRLLVDHPVITSVHRDDPILDAARIVDPPGGATWQFWGKHPI